MKSCTTASWSTTCASAARCSSKSSTKCRTARTVIFSAHGVSQAVRNEAARPRPEGIRRDLPAGDQGAHRGGAALPRRPRRGADRPRRASRRSKARWASGRPKPGRAGSIWSRTSTDVAIGWRSRSRTTVAYTTQTTLSVDDTRDIIDALQARFPAMQGRGTTTSATPPRTARTPCASWPADCDLVLVVGSVNSSNSNRLRELAEKQGAAAYLIDGAENIDPAWLAGKRAHRRHRRRLRARSPGAGRDRAPAGARRQRRCANSHGEPENMVFALPKELRFILVE